MRKWHWWSQAEEGLNSRAVAEFQGTAGWFRHPQRKGNASIRSEGLLKLVKYDGEPDTMPAWLSLDQAWPPLLSRKHDDAFHNPAANCSVHSTLSRLKTSIPLVLSPHHNYVCLTDHSTLLWIHLCPLNALSVLGRLCAEYSLKSTLQVIHCVLISGFNPIILLPLIVLWHVGEAWNTVLLMEQPPCTHRWGSYSRNVLIFKII